MTNEEAGIMSGTEQIELKQEQSQQQSSQSDQPSKRERERDTNRSNRRYRSRSRSPYSSDSDSRRSRRHTSDRSRRRSRSRSRSPARSRYSDRRSDRDDYHRSDRYRDEHRHSDRDRRRDEPRSNDPSVNVPASTESVAPRPHRLKWLKQNSATSSSPLNEQSLDNKTSSYHSKQVTSSSNSMNKSSESSTQPNITFKQPLLRSVPLAVQQQAMQSAQQPSNQASAQSATMIEVVLNDRLGKKVRVKVNSDDTILTLKKLTAAQIGTPYEKLVIKKWYTVYKDNIRLDDYEIHDGMGLELYYR